jgi:XisH protein
MAKDLFHNTVKIALQKDGWTLLMIPINYAMVLLMSTLT